MKIGAARLSVVAAVFAAAIVCVPTGFAASQIGDATKFTVGANDSDYYRFTVPNDGKKHSIRVIFQIDPGSYVTGYLLNMDQFARYMSKTRNGDYDQIGQSVNDADDGMLDYSITADLDAGDYEIVFVNNDPTPASLRMLQVRDYTGKE